MVTALLKSIKKWTLKRRSVGRKHLPFMSGQSPIYIIDCQFPINYWSIYLQGRKKIYPDFFPPDFTLVFLCLKLWNNHSTHVQQTIMKPQVFISIQNGFIFFPFPLNSDLTRVLISRKKDTCSPFLRSTYKLGIFFLKAVSSSYKSDFRIYLSLSLWLPCKAFFSTRNEYSEKTAMAFWPPKGEEFVLLAQKQDEYKLC